MVTARQMRRLRERANKLLESADDAIREETAADIERFLEWCEAAQEAATEEERQEVEAWCAEIDRLYKEGIEEAEADAIRAGKDLSLARMEYWFECERRLEGEREIPVLNQRMRAYLAEQDARRG